RSCWFRINDSNTGSPLSTRVAICSSATAAKDCCARCAISNASDSLSEPTRFASRALYKIWIKKFAYKLQLDKNVLRLCRETACKESVKFLTALREYDRESRVFPVFSFKDAKFCRLSARAKSGRPSDITSRIAKARKWNDSAFI